MTKAGARGAENKDAETGAGSAARPAFAKGETTVDVGAIKGPPLMTHPTAVMAAATAIGFEMASQWAGLFAGMMQGVATSMERATAGKPEPELAAEAGKATVPAAKASEANGGRAVDAEAGAAPAKARKIEKAAVTVQKPVSKPVAARRKAKPVAKPPKTAPETVKETARIAATDAFGQKAAGKALAPKRAATGETGADDLKQIAGIGPRLEQELLGRGISGFAEIAAWSAEEAERIDGELGLSGRVIRDDWVGKAKALVAKAG